MKQLPTALALLAGLLLATPAPAAAGLHAAERGSGRLHLGGVRVDARSATRQVLTVNRTSGWHARVSWWEREDGRWRREVVARDGRIGYGGLVRAHRRVQGSGATPLGTFRLPWAFGMHPRREAWDSSYRQVRRGDYWVLDNASDHYNRYRNKRQAGFRWRLGSSSPNASERLRDFPRQYEWAIATSFNHRQVRHRGGAIFVHVNGDGATAGCVSAPRWFVHRLVRRLDPDRAPVVAVGR